MQSSFRCVKMRQLISCLDYLFISLFCSDFYRILLKAFRLFLMSLLYVLELHFAVEEGD